MEYIQLWKYVAVIEKLFEEYLSFQTKKLVLKQHTTHV